MTAENGTNVQSNARSWLNYGLGVVGGIWPAGAAAIAAEMFLTAPPRRKKFEEEVALFQEAERTWITSDGEYLPLYRFGSGPAVLLLHGWGGSSGQLHPFVRPLLERGRSVVTFDAPGHGDATGTWLAIPRFADAILQVAREVGTLEAVIGHSMGGAAAAFATSLGFSADRFVLIGPPASELDMFRQFARYLGFGQRLSQLTELQVEARVGVTFARLLPQPMAATIDSPLLVIHDRDDREVPFADGAAIARAAPDGHLLATSGLGHRRILRDPRVVEHAADFAVGLPLRKESTGTEASNPAWV